MDAGDPERAVPTAPGPFAEVPTPAGQGSMTPRLASDGERTLMAFQVDTRDAAGAPYVAFAELGAAGWSDVRTIVQRPDLFVNWADYPSVVPTGRDGLVAHWLQYNGPGTYAYQVRVAFSSDGGRAWSESLVPHEPRTQTEHGFVTLVPEAGGLQVVWLDGRAYEEGPAEEMSLRTARVTPEGATNEVVLDRRTCDCCQTSVAALGDTLIVAYRGRSPGEIRDIEVVRRVDGSWTAPATVHRDGWEIGACPVNGPAIAAAGSDVLVGWFTAENDDARVLVARSIDGGASFDAPVRIDDGRPIGRVAVLPLSDRSFAVAWVEVLADGGAEVRVRRVADVGVSPSRTAGGTTDSRASGFPTLALHDGDLLVAWTDPDAGRVRMASGPIP